MEKQTETKYTDWRAMIVGLGTTLNAPPPLDLQDVINLPRISSGVDVVNVEGSTTTAAAASLVENLSAKTVKVLGNNTVVRVAFSETRGAIENAAGDQVAVEGEVVINGQLDCLKWSAANNKKVYRRLVRDHYNEYLRRADEEDEEEALKIWRLLRAVSPVKNFVSKQEPVMGAGLTTLSKIRLLGSKVASVSNVIFGVGNWRHNMGYYPNTRICVDTNAWSAPDEGPYYVKGSLKDWRKYVWEGEFIISDCSYGDGGEGGMIIPEEFGDIYRSMVEDGHYVLCKVSKFSSWIYRTPVVDYSYYRPHNAEMFILMSPNEEENVRYLDREEIMEDMRQWNNFRMRNIRSGEFEIIFDRLTITEAEMAQARKVAKAMYHEGLKNTSVVDGLLAELNPVMGGVWMDWCLDPNIDSPNFDEYYCLNETTPIILMDVGHLAKDLGRLFASFFRYYKMYFDEDVGWVAIERSSAEIGGPARVRGE